MAERSAADVIGSSGEICQVAAQLTTAYFSSQHFNPTPGMELRENVYDV